MQNPAQPDIPPVAMIVVDTEGLGAYDEDENHDAKIFLLALLLSSLLIYNSVGTIDENALNSLSLVINLSKKI
jgi:Guanylate-binding protein, N-terminal domain